VRPTRRSIRLSPPRRVDKQVLHDERDSIGLLGGSVFNNSTIVRNDPPVITLLLLTVT